VLDQHPDIACVWESYALYQDSNESIFNTASDKWKTHGFSEDDVARWRKEWQKDTPKNLLYRLLRKLTKYDYYRIYNLRSTMRQALGDFSERCNARVSGDKWPWYADYIHILTEAFPEARFIYNVRDPRGIWNSAQNFKGRKRGDEILQEMLDKDKKISSYQDRDNFLTVRYEDLLSKPEDVCMTLYQFLGCEYSESFREYDPASDRYPGRWSWIPEASEQLNPHHATKWKTQMDASDISHVNAAADSFIRKYHYIT